MAGKKKKNPADTLEELAQLAAARCESMSLFQYWVYQEEDHPDAGWRIDICEGATELVGGKDDGARVHAGFHADITAIVGLLKPPIYLSGATQPIISFDCTIGSKDPVHVAIDGSYAGIDVMISIYSLPLSDKVAMTMNERHEIEYKDDPPEDDDDE